MRDNCPFRVELVWYTHPNFKEAIDRAWSKGGEDLEYKLEKLTNGLKAWNVNVFGKQRCVTRLEGIQKILCQKPLRHLEKLEKKLLKEYNSLLEQQEIFWF